jgi:Smg protein
MITLFSLIANEVQSKQELFDEEGKIMQALLNSGCRLQEADAALTLMQTLVQRQSEEVFTQRERPAAAISMRALNREERDRFTVDAFGFVTKLTSLGIIGEDQREELLERAMTVYTERIELDHIKTLVAFTLFVHPHEQDISTPAISRRIKKTSWN